MQMEGETKMGILVTALAGILAFSPLQAKWNDSSATVRIVSGGKTVATLITPCGRISISGNDTTVRIAGAKSTITVKGKVSLTVIRNGEKLLDLSADEIVVEEQEAAK